MKLPKVKLYRLGAEVTFKLGINQYTGTIAKIMKPGYQFRDSDIAVVRYLIHLSDNRYIVLPHSLLNSAYSD